MLKKTKEEIIELVRNMILNSFSAHRATEHKDPTYKICEVCGCLIDSARAVEGESIIKCGDSYRKEIYTPYYCQVHAPGKLAKETERYQTELNSLYNKLVKIEQKYNELIGAIPDKCAGENRHERALRYIKQYQILVDKELVKEEKE